MSELITAHASGTGLRWQLLATVSAVAMAAAFPAQSVSAAEADRPTVWIEGGWHFDDVVGTNDPFVTPLDSETRASGFPSSTEIQRILAKAYGAEGSISFQPSHTDWVFSVSGRYGRAHTARNVHQEKPLSGPTLKKTFLDGRGTIPYTPTLTGYVQQKADNSESHTILDFQVGKDLGIGLLGRGTDSIISFGARYAQFSSRSQLDAHALPFASFEQFTTPGFLIHPKYKISTQFHASASYVDRHTSLHVVGPSISMSNTTGLIGQPDSGQLALDWSANAAILFGRQRVRVSHQATAQQLVYQFGYVSALGPIVAPPVAGTRSHSVVVPNLGGSAALSFRFTNAKVSLGYRADFFFGAMDRGLDVRDAGTVGFHGPFATVSIGLGG